MKGWTYVVSVTIIQALIVHHSEIEQSNARATSAMPADLSQHHQIQEATKRNIESKNRKRQHTSSNKLAAVYLAEIGIRKLFTPYQSMKTELH